MILYLVGAGILGGLVVGLITVFFKQTAPYRDAADQFSVRAASHGTRAHKIRFCLIKQEAV